ncbi:MAG: Bacterioopsin transcriptional activator [Methanosaeta sp. PtaU1.Bin028]|nr:MAG: Bacterioopsin transcriptional activator [Methanosaeta sp. PtaU1.Bin028]
MNLREKTLIVVGISLFLLIVILYTAAQIELMISYSNLEENVAKQDVEKALNAFEADLSSLRALARFWASRNDTISLMEGDSPSPAAVKYLNEAISNESLRNVDIDLLLFMNSYGQEVYHRYLDASGEARNLPEDLPAQLILYGFCPGCLDKRSSSSGMIILSGTPMLIVAVPIVENQEAHTSSGRVVVGRYLDSREISRLSQITQLNLTVYAISDTGRMPTDFLKILPDLLEGRLMQVQLLSQDRIGGYSILNNIYGNPLLVLRVDTPRNIYRQGMSSLTNFIILFSVAGFAFLALTLIYLDRTVLSMLAFITSGVASIAESQNLTSRLAVKGRDELSHLAISINSMIEALQKAHEDLSESEKRYKAVVEEQSDLIIRNLADGTINFANDVFCEYLSTHRDNIIGQKIDDLIPPENLNTVETAVAALSLENPTVVFETKLSSPKGIKWIQWTSHAIFDGSAQLAEIQSVGRDITQLKQSEEALRQSEERYRLVSENTNDVVTLHDMNMRYLYISPSMLNQTGYSPEELIGKSPLDIIYPEDIKYNVDSLAELIARKTPLRLEYRVRIRDGSLVWVETTANPVLDANGKMVYIQGTHRNVNERKQAEQDLKESRQLMSDLISFLPDAIVAIDLDGRITFWNRAMEALTGVESKYMLGKRNYEHSLPFYGMRRPILIDMVLRSYQDMEGEYIRFQREGTAVTGEVFIPTFGPKGSYLLGKATALYDSSGKIIGAIESIRDITESRTMEKQLDLNRAELHVAALIQQSFIPDRDPDVPGFQLASITRPAMEVGGDFYDFIMQPDGRCSLVIADVAGKSISAALFMALSRTIVRANATNQPNLTEVLKSTNKMIAAEAPEGMFVTLIYGVLDGRDQSFRYANAGHPPPLVFRSNGRSLEEESSSDVALGAMEGALYRERLLRFCSGDVALFYTDGVTETMDADGRMYGTDRLIEVVRRSCTKSAQQIIDDILADISAFSGSREQHDDITMVAVKALDPIGGHLKLQIAADEQQIPALMDQIERMMSDGGFAREKILDMQVSVEEACVNIIHHGYRHEPGIISIGLYLEEDALQITIEDDAPPFDPTKFDKPNLVQNLDERPIGGLGILMMKSMTDDLRYDFAGGKNRLTLTKRRG